MLCRSPIQSVKIQSFNWLGVLKNYNLPWLTWMTWLKWLTWTFKHSKLKSFGSHNFLCILTLTKQYGTKVKFCCSIKVHRSTGWIWLTGSLESLINFQHGLRPVLAIRRYHVDSWLLSPCGEGLCISFLLTFYLNASILLRLDLNASNKSRTWNPCFEIIFLNGFNCLQ